MMNQYCIPVVVLAAIALAGPVLAEVTSGPETALAGDVYTTGSISVTSAPPGASATLDGGGAQLITPGTFYAVPPGKHNVIVAKPGYQPRAENVEVRAGAKAEVIVTLAQTTNPGGISVSTTPRGAGLSVDGVNQGITDQIIGNLAPGRHVVTLSLSGYLPWSSAVTVNPGQVTPVTVPLTPETNPPTGDLRVTSTPAGASVFVNGDYKGVTPAGDPLDITDLSPGVYSVILRRSGFLDYSATTEIRAGKEVRIDAVLLPSPSSQTATATISSSPSGADVYIDNMYMGITPLTFQNVTTGTYTVELRLEGYAPFSTSGEVAPGKDIQVVAVLSPTAPATTKAAPCPLEAAMAFIVACAAIARRLSG